MGWGSGLPAHAAPGLGQVVGQVQISGSGGIRMASKVSFGGGGADQQKLTQLGIDDHALGATMINT